MSQSDDPQRDDPQTADKPAEAPASPPRKGILGIHPMKLMFAFEYILQGVGNPWQGITYQPFFAHLTNKFGLGEAAVQGYFSRSYLAWSFKPVIGFFIDAYGKTRTILVATLGLATLMFLLTPFFDSGPEVFFWYMFVLSVLLAATDVAVDRASVVAGDEEAAATGQSKAATVGLNQSISWAAIYGTGIVTAIAGGYVATHFEYQSLMYVLALAPFTVLLVALQLPPDKATPIPLLKSVSNFWEGLNTGPILWIIVFYFMFHFQPAAGAIMTNYQLETLKFTQDQAGFTDGMANVGYFFGVVLFAKYGVAWQDKVGLKRLFKIFILLSIGANLTQYTMLDPWFTRGAGALNTVLPFLDGSQARIAWYSVYNIVFYTFMGFTRMSTFSLVGSVIPSNAAGSLFAGFMSVANLAYSFSYSSGAWLYEHGLEVGFVRTVQQDLFGIPAKAGESMSMVLLVFIGSMAFLLSFIASNKLPDQRETRSSDDATASQEGPRQYAALGQPTLRALNIGMVLTMAAAFSLLFFGAGSDPIQCVLLSFFGSAFLRKVALETLYRRRGAASV